MRIVATERWPQIYRKNHNAQLSIKDIHEPFCGTLDPDNRWELLAELIPCKELEEAYGPKFVANGPTLLSSFSRAPEYVLHASSASHPSHAKSPCAALDLAAVTL